MTVTKETGVYERQRCARALYQLNQLRYRTRHQTWNQITDCTLVTVPFTELDSPRAGFIVALNSHTTYPTAFEGNCVRKSRVGLLCRHRVFGGRPTGYLDEKEISRYLSPTKETRHSYQRARGDWSGHIGPVGKALIYLGYNI
jgi:hypothetical protein